MEDNGRNYSILGKPVPRVDARLKVTGQAKYAADYETGGMLWGKIKRAPYAHARILNIDTSKAERLPGVKGVIVGKEFGGFKWGWQAHTRDESPLAADKVRYMYEGVAAVAATDKDIAEEACDLIDVEYEELPGVFDPFEAMKEGAPLVHEDRPKNILVEYHWNFGDVDKAFDDAHLVREDVFQTPKMAKGYIEPPAVVAWWEHGTLHLHRGEGQPLYALEDPGQGVQPASEQGADHLPGRRLRLRRDEERRPRPRLCGDPAREEDRAGRSRSFTASGKSLRLACGATR